MAEDGLDHLALRGGGNELQWPLLAARIAHHSERKPLLAQPHRAPARSPRVRRLLVDTLLAERRHDRAAQVAVRCQAPPIAHEMHAGQEYERGQIRSSPAVLSPSKGANRLGAGVDCLARRQQDS